MKCIFGDFSRYVSIDLETTGYSRMYDEVIECAAIRYEEGREVDSFVSLAKPKRTIDQFISAKTGITNEMVADKPGFETLVEELISFIGEDVILGHNVSFDLGFLNAYGAILKNDYIDTMRLSRRLFPEEEHHRLEDLCNRLLNDPKRILHRAGEDSRSTAECYEIFRSYCRDNGIDMTVLGIPTKRIRKNKLKASDITTSNTEFDPDTPFYGRSFVFTGTLDLYPRKEAMQIVVDNGGEVANSVSTKTNVLVIGTQDYARVGETGKSSKMKKAEELILKGADLEIVSEDAFMEMVRQIKRNN